MNQGSPNSVGRERQHPLVIRVTHWVNFIALGIMVLSGLRIYNASPIWAFKIPPAFTFGGWLAGARQWHFLSMWLFLINGVIWFLYNIVSRHGRKTTLFSPARDSGGLLPMIQYYLRIRKEHPPVVKYNSLQKAAYTSVPALAAGAVLSGIAIYWPVQFSFITQIFGNYDSARVWHFIFMSALVLFFMGHLFMVAISGWSNFLSIITGWKKVTRR
jgi:thiosulfate reductase cytochrome b subunit